MTTHNGALAPAATLLTVLATVFVPTITTANADELTSTTNVLAMGAPSTNARFASWSATARTSQASARSKVEEEAAHRDEEMTEQGAAIADVVVTIADVLAMTSDAVAARVATKAVAEATLDAEAVVGEGRIQHKTRQRFRVSAMLTITSGRLPLLMLSVTLPLHPCTRL